MHQEEIGSFKHHIDSTWRWTASIANQLRFGMVSLVVASLLSTGGVLIYSSFQTQLKQSDLLQQERSQIAAQKIDAYIDDLQRKLSYLARVRGLTDLPDATKQTLLEGLTRHNDAYEMVAILNREAQPVAVVSPYGSVSLDNLATSSLFVRTLKQQEDYVDNATIDPVTRQLVTTIAVPIRNQQDQVDGVLLAKINLRFLEFVVSQTDVGKTGYAYVVDNRNVVIAKKGNTAENLKLEDISKRPFIHTLTGRKTEKLTVYQGLEQVEVLGAIAPIRSVSWSVIVELPTTEAYASVYQLILTMAGALSLATLTAVGLGIFFSRRLVSPLQSLTTAAVQISNGNLEAQVNLRSHNELGILAQSFNQMAQQLRESFSALANTNIELERRVEQRTAELKEAKEAADTANSAKSEFLANMSHELRTPLNGILGYAQILQRSKTLADPEVRNVDIIYQCGSHLLTLINDILDLSKIEARKMELYQTDFHFPAFVQGVVEICRIRAEQKGIVFIYQPPAELPIGIHADEKRLRQVLINLLGNAIKFTETGNVTFKVEVLETREFSQSPITHHPSPISTIRFQIEDTGIGMSPEQLEKIFLPFEQVGETKRQTEGTGLGLAISQKIIQMMGSTIQVKSQSGQGSVFWLDLDLPQALEWVQTATMAAQGKIIGIRGKKQKILVVDDKWENRSVIVSLLEPIGFEMAEATNGQEGLEKAQEFQPNLIITDLVMPVLDGFELIQSIRKTEQFQDIPIIVSSASVFQSDQNKSLQAGGDDFLPKPVQADELLQKLQKYLQLEWIYGQSQRQEGVVVNSGQETANRTAKVENLKLIIPPLEEINTLSELALRGNLKEILRQAAKLEQMNEEFTPFTKIIREFAINFQDKEILEFINQNKEILELTNQNKESQSS